MTIPDTATVEDLLVAEFQENYAQTDAPVNGETTLVDLDLDNSPAMHASVVFDIDRALREGGHTIDVKSSERAALVANATNVHEFAAAIAAKVVALDAETV